MPDLPQCVGYHLVSRSSAQIVMTDLDCTVQPIEIRQACTPIFRCFEGWEGQPCAGCPCGAIQTGRNIDISGGSANYTIYHTAKCVTVDTTLAASNCPTTYPNSTCFILDGQAEICFCYTA